MNWAQFPVPHQHRKHFSVMVDCYASDLGSVPSQVNFIKKFILLNALIRQNYEEND